MVLIDELRGLAGVGAVLSYLGPYAAALLVDWITMLMRKTKSSVLFRGSRWGARKRDDKVLTRKTTRAKVL